jgi:hypothetical protein
MMSAGRDVEPVGGGEELNAVNSYGCIAAPTVLAE